MSYMKFTQQVEVLVIRIVTDVNNILENKALY